MQVRVRWAVAAAILFIYVPRAGAAEWQFKPFIGGTYGGETTFLFVRETLTLPADNYAHASLGGNALWLGEILGIEADFGHTPRFFQGTDAPHVIDSGVTTVTGNVVVAMPRRLAQYTLRPYVVGGAGLMHIRYDLEGGLQTLSNLQAMDLGAGVTGFLTRRVGVSWDVRYFRSIDRTREFGQSIDSEHLTFWRASMALAIRL
jgi:hypothetical protein